MEYPDLTNGWSSLDQNPYNRDPSANCLPCKTVHMPPTRAVPAPPPAPGQAPCVACPSDATFAQRLITRDSGPPCCVTEKYGYNQEAWPYNFGGHTVTPDTMDAELFQDLYVIKDRVADSSNSYTPIFNAYVL